MTGERPLSCQAEATRLAVVALDPRAHPGFPGR